jgi:Ni,Fe-hydrogenase III large subunit
MKVNALQVDKLRWLRIAEDFSAGRATLFGMWGEQQLVHLCWLDHSGTSLSHATLAAEDGRYSSIARRHAPALRFERMIAELNGLKAEGCPDTRAWLTHGADYVFLPVEGTGVHQIPVGPIHAGIIEPGHFRFSVNGETVVRLETRLGYAHKGVERLMQGGDVTVAAKLAARISGDSTVAYSFAFALAAEAALGVAAPARAQWLRGLMAELERLANHFGDIGFICNDAAMVVLHAHFGLLREECLQLCDQCFGHRLMMDRICPGGVAEDVSARQMERIRDRLGAAEARFDRLVSIYDNSASIKDRTLHTGRLTPELAARFGAGGVIGRASGRNFDARKNLAYAPYDQLDFSVTTVNAGDVNARLWVRQAEVRQSFRLIRQITALLPRGEIFRPLPSEPTEGCDGMAVVEGFRGDVLVWLRLGEDGTVLRCHPRDPSWLQWPLLEAVIEGNIVADFPLCNKSFNCSYSGHDL